MTKNKKAKRKLRLNHELLMAGVEFRDSLLDRADRMYAGTYPLWHGWAIVDAFIAGAKWQASQPTPNPQEPR